MKPDPKAEGQRWLQQARNDLRDARVLAEAGSHASACFHAQQTAEKALQGVLIAKGEQAPRVHAVSELMSRVSRHVELPEELSVATALDGYYVPTRYPDMMPEGVPDDTYQEADSSAAMQFAETVLRFAEDQS